MVTIYELLLVLFLTIFILITLIHLRKKRSSHQPNKIKVARALIGAGGQKGSQHLPLLMVIYEIASIHARRLAHVPAVCVNYTVHIYRKIET